MGGSFIVQRLVSDGETYLLSVTFFPIPKLIPKTIHCTASLGLLFDLKCEGVALGLRHDLDLVFRGTLRRRWLGGGSLGAGPLVPVRED